MPESYFMEGDIQALIDGAGGIPVIIGGVTAKCLRDVEDETVATAESGSIMGRLIVVQAKTGVFPGLDVDVAAVVEGENYIVKSILKVTDGGLTMFRCARA